MNICSKSFTRIQNRHYEKTFLVVFTVSALVVFICSLLAGPSSLTVVQIWEWISGVPSHEKVHNIILYVRLPRSIACALTGAALAVSGLLLQSTLNNALASPGIIGVNAGAGLFVVVAALLFPSVMAMRYFAAFLGALLTVLFVYAIAKKTGASRMTIVMSGIAISSLMTAGIDTVVTLYPHTLTDKTAFFIGGFSGVTMDSIYFALPYIIIGIISAFLLASRINILILGDEVASSLGLNVELFRFLTIVTAAALAASAVSLSGLLGFIGLIVPHITRLIAGNNHKLLVPLTALVGINLTLICDILARLLFAPMEIPVGIILSFLGAPFFLYLLLRKKRGRL